MPKNNICTIGINSKQAQESPFQTFPEFIAIKNNFHFVSTKKVRFIPKFDLPLEFAVYVNAIQSRMFSSAKMNVLIAMMIVLTLEAFAKQTIQSENIEIENNNCNQ